MQPEELEGRRCRKKKNAVARSPKSRSCKVDVVNCKGFARGGLFDIVVYTFSDYTESLFMS
jgi:hypothetical protein